MKKLLFLLAICSGLSSCSEDPAFLTNQMLDGSWEVTAYFIDNDDVFGENALISAATYTFTMGEDAGGNLTIETSSLGKETETTVSYVISGDDGNVITMTDDDGEITEGSVVAGGEALTLEYFNAEGKREIIEATKS